MNDRAVGSDAKRLMLYDARKKGFAIPYLLWLFLGVFGVHRFYLGHSVSGLIQLLVFVGAGVLNSYAKIGNVGNPGLFAIPLAWWVIDAFLIPGMVRSHNTKLAEKLG